MPRLLYDTTTSTLAPYPRQDDEPVVGLDPRYLEMSIIQQEQPSYDPVTEQLAPTEAIDTDARTVTRGWTINELPIIPIMNWDSFKEQALNSSVLNTILLEAYQRVPVAASALIPSLLKAENNQLKDFEISWKSIVTELNISEEIINGFVTIAEECNLPQEFINILNAG
jgi:hypothetical protein